MHVYSESCVRVVLGLHVMQTWTGQIRDALDVTMRVELTSVGIKFQNF